MVYEVDVFGLRAGVAQTGGKDGKPHFDCYDTNKLDNISESCFLKRP